MTKRRSFEDQAKQLVNLVQAIPPKRATQSTLHEILTLAHKMPKRFFPKTFPKMLAEKFGVDVASLNGIAAQHEVKDARKPFDPLVPNEGWLNTYVKYTSEIESPTAFHFFAAVTVLGATIARRVCFARGAGDIYPNISCVLVAPPGIAKKTTACNRAVELYRRIGGNVLADKVTPEALIDAFRDESNATGLLYAPEWAVFLGKQKYMEGLVPMLTALFDCPDEWSSGTIMRGNTTLTNVALSHLAASTVDWMQTSVTKDALDGGFMSRLLYIFQPSTNRCVPFPPPLDEKLKTQLVNGLLAIQRVTGNVIFDTDAYDWYVEWYTKARKTPPAEKYLAGYFERKPDRMIQLAMVLNMARYLDKRALVLDRETLVQALSMLEWVEQYLPDIFEELSSTATGDAQLRLMKQIRQHKGSITHSMWLRLNRNRMDSQMFKKCVDTLLHANMVTYDESKKTYYTL